MQFIKMIFFRKKQIYMDNAATTKVDENITKEMEKAMTKYFGNPSSIHAKGLEAKKEIENARAMIANSIGAKSKEIIFTGSGTEANNLALKGLFWENKNRKNHIITTKIEHDCVLNSCKWLEKQGAEVTYLEVDKKGFISLEKLKNSIKKNTLVVSIIHGNNEIGTIQDIEKIGEICKKYNVYFHTDACQSYTKVPINVKKQNIDLMTLNAHKINGPKGVGALYLKQGIKINPLLHGGGQEDNLRSSTYNVPGIIGFAKAVKNTSSSDVEKMKQLTTNLIKGLKEIPNSRLNGPEADKRLCNNINFSLKNREIIERLRENNIIIFL